MPPFWDNKNEKIFLFWNFRLWLSSYVQNDLNTQLTPSLLALLPTTPQKLPDMKLSPVRMSTLLLLFSTSVELDVRNVRPSVRLSVRMAGNYGQTAWYYWFSICMVTFIITVGDLYEKKFSSAPPLTAGGPISCFLAVFLVNFGAHVLAHLGCSNYYFCIYGIYEEFSRKQIFFGPNSHFWALGRGPKLVPNQKFLNFFFFLNFVILNQEKQ